MCARYCHEKTDPSAIAQRFYAQLRLPKLFEAKARFNIAPTDRVPIVVVEDNERFVESAVFGYIPPHAAKPIPGFIGEGKRPLSTINARDDKIASSRLYAGAFKHRRCIVPARGFFEWTGPKRNRMPYFIRLMDGGLFGFAGVWSRWESKGGEEPVNSFAIITTDANALMAPIHNRMPVILKREDEATWLDPSMEDPTILTGLLVAYPADAMEAYRVSTFVNKPGNEGPECVQRVA